jgi:hypothetical protein
MHRDAEFSKLRHAWPFRTMMLNRERPILLNLLQLNHLDLDFYARVYATEEDSDPLAVKSRDKARTNTHIS